MIERNKTNVALETLFDEVFKIISEARRVPLTDKIMVDENDLLNIIDDLKEAIPREIKSANQVLEEQKSIVSQAYADAERIVQNAREEAERIVSEAQANAEAKIQQEEIVKQANAVAEETKAEALRYQEEIRSGADAYAADLKKESLAYALKVKQDSLQYAEDMMAYLGSDLESALANLKENRNNLSAAMNNLGSEPVEETVEQEIEK